MLNGGKKTIQRHKVCPCLFSFWDKTTFCFKFKAVSMDTASLLCDSEGRKHVACVRFRTCTHAYYNRFSVWLYRNILSIKHLEQIHVCFINNQLKTIQKTTEKCFFQRHWEILNVVLPVMKWININQFGARIKCFHWKTAILENDTPCLSTHSVKSNVIFFIYYLM